MSLAELPALKESMELAFDDIRLSSCTRKELVGWARVLRFIPWYRWKVADENNPFAKPYKQLWYSIVHELETASAADDINVQQQRELLQTAYIFHALFKKWLSLFGGTTSAATSEVKNLLREDCSIRWNSYKDHEEPQDSLTRLKPCGHEFYTSCVAKHFHTQLANRIIPSCPICRLRIFLRPIPLIPIWAQTLTFLEPGVDYTPYLAGLQVDE
jgi:hypothetical protein